MTDTAEIYQFPGAQTPPEGSKRGPQVEDGYTRIAHELLEAVTNSQTCPVTLRQLRVVLAVIRKTYGYNKKADRISDGQLAAVTGMSRQNVNAAKRELLAMKVLQLDGYQIGVNKHHADWDFTARPEKDNLKQTRDSVSKPETKSVSKSGSHKRQKDTLSTDVEREAPKARRQRLDVTAFADDISADTLQAFAEHRRAMRAPLTQRALELTVKAAIKAAGELGITAEQAIDEAITAGWKTVRAEWLRNRGAGKPDTADTPACPHADILAIWDDTCGRVKGAAPNLLDWQGTKAADALAERWAEFYNAEVNGRVRYDSPETGLDWWRMALSHIAGKQDFRNADIDIWTVFYKTRLSKAANGNLCQQGGATR